MSQSVCRPAPRIMPSSGKARRLLGDLDLSPHSITWAGAWPPPDGTMVVCDRCGETLLYAHGFLSTRDEYGEF